MQRPKTFKNWYLVRLLVIGRLLILLTVVPSCKTESSTETSRPARAKSDVQEVHQQKAPSRESPVKLVVVNQESVPRFEFRDGQDAGHLAIVESLGSGVGLRDFDLDGSIDVFLPGGGKFLDDKTICGNPSGLFRNLGDWKFEDISQIAQVDQAPHFTHGAAIGDFNEDGFADVLLTGYGGLLLWQNLGDGTFIEATSTAGLLDKLWSSSAAWGDVNGDGLLDLYVVHYVNWSFDNHPRCVGPNGKRDVCPPRDFEGLPDTLYLNQGDGTFRDATLQAGLKPDGKGLGAVLADVDLDGDLDIYVGNDTVANFLYRNDGTGKFEEMAEHSGTALNDRGIPDGSMGVEVADCNLDGQPDILVANYEFESIALYRNDGQFLFFHDSRAMGLSATGTMYVGWGTAFFDVDHDGDEDVFVSNGHVIRFPTNSAIEQLPQLFLNLNGKRFENVAQSAGEYTSSPHRGRGVACGDIDRDGKNDLVVSRVNQPVAFLRNASVAENNWITLRLIGRKSNRDAIGTQVRIHSSYGTRLRMTKGGGSFASTHDAPLNIGLGQDREAKRIEIRWPSGATQELVDVPGNRVVVLHEPDE